MGYWKVFFGRMFRESTAWARDNLFWAAVMALVPAIAVYLRNRHHLIDWDVVWTAAWLYALAAIMYFAYHFLRTMQRMDGDHIQATNILKSKLETQVAITDLLADDPRLEAEFVDERAHGDSNIASLRVTNRGKLTAYLVRVAPIKLRARMLVFQTITDSLDESLSARFAPFVGVQWGYDSHCDLLRALSEEWVKDEIYPDKREAVIPVRIDYENEAGVRFEANFEIVYLGGYLGFNPNHITIAKCQNFTYRRIPIGVTPQ